MTNEQMWAQFAAACEKLGAMDESEHDHPTGDVETDSLWALWKEAMAVAVPEGWQVVPKTLTPEMIEAWNDSGADDMKIPDPFHQDMSAEDWATWKKAHATMDWNALLATAPKPETHHD